MAWVADYHDAAEVPETGGLGIIGAGGAPASWVRERMKEARKYMKMWKEAGVRVIPVVASVVHENYKNLVIKAKDIDTRVTGIGIGHPVRVIQNKQAKEYRKNVPVKSGLSVWQHRQKS